MIVITIIALCTFVGYIVYISKQFGLIKSISESFYELEYEKRGTGLYFTVWCGLITLFTLPPSLHFSSGWLESILSVVMCIGLISVGASPAFNNKTYRPYHLVGAVLSAGSAIVLSLMWGYWYIVAGLAVISTIAQFCTTKRDVVLWLEIGCFIAYFLALLLQCF